VTGVSTLVARGARTGDGDAAAEVAKNRDPRRAEMVLGFMMHLCRERRRAANNGFVKRQMIEASQFSLVRMIK